MIYYKKREVNSPLLTSGNKLCYNLNKEAEFNMGDLEEKREEIGYLKFLMGVVTAIIMGLISWFVANLEQDTVLIYFDMFGVIVALVLWFLLHKKITKDIKSLKDL